MNVIGAALHQLVQVRIEVQPEHAIVVSAWHDMKHVLDHAIRDEHLPVLVEVRWLQWLADEPSIV